MRVAPTTQSRRRTKASENTARAAVALAQTGTRLYRLGCYEEAAAPVEQALAMTVALRGEAHPELLPILYRLARIFLQLGRLKDAWRTAERAVKIADAACGSESIESAAPLAILAESFFGLGLLDRCHVVAERALAIVGAALGEDHPETAKACVRLGVLLSALGEYQRARKLLERALAVMRARRRRDWIAAILASLAETYLAAGQPGAARPLYEEAAVHARAVFGAKHANTGAYLAALGHCYAAAGEAERALAHYRRALAVLRAALGETHPQVGMLMLNLGRLQAARGRRAGMTTIFQAIAIIGSGQRRLRMLTDVYLALARTLESTAAQILFWKLAINDIESVRAHVARLDAKLERVFVRRNEADFRMLGDALIRRGRLPEAQQVLAMIKQGELFHLTGIDARKTRVALTPLEAQWAAQGARLMARIRVSLRRASDSKRSTPQQRARLHRIIARGGRTLRTWYEALAADFAAAETAPSAAPSTPAQQIPGPDTALLQYLFAPEPTSLNIMLTGAQGQREARVTFADGEVNRLVYAMREAVQERSPGFLPAAQRLHQILLAPVEDALRAAGTQTLALSLDGVLRYLPLAALHDGERYLLERFALVMTTDAVAVGERDRRKQRAAGLGLSRPIPGFRPLHAVRDELRAVIRTDKSQGILPGAIWLDQEFTAQSLRHALSADNSVVHIASHFVFEAARETTSYLLLGDGTRFTLSDLGELRCDGVELMVLSACNTAIGGGHGREIEGVGALARHRGARTVLATLWPVADLTTAALMRDFYQHAYEMGLEPAQALRRAQLALLNGNSSLQTSTTTRSLVDSDNEQTDAISTTKHPFYWAPYILMGEAGD